MNYVKYKFDTFFRRLDIDVFDSPLYILCTHNQLQQNASLRTLVHRCTQSCLLCTCGYLLITSLEHPVLTFILPAIFSHLQVNLRGIVNIVSTQVHQSGGVVRDLKNLGINMTLPQRIRRMRQYYSTGE